MSKVSAHEAVIPTKYADQYENILSATLTTENIDSYAEDALENLVGVIDRAITDYSTSETITLTPRELEDEACRYFGMGGVELALDHIAHQATLVRQLDARIERVAVSDSVVVPPQSPGITIQNGNSEFIDNRVLPKLKTVLFVLQNEFDIDTEDPQQLELTRGNVTPEMMRKEPYFIVRLPELNRTIFVCDESGNLTYVLNDEELAEIGLSSKDVQHLDKREINNLLKHHTSAGQAVIYSKHFIPRLVDAIELPQFNKAQVSEKSTGQYLRPRAPEDVLSFNKFREKYHLGNVGIIEKAIAELGEDFGDVHEYLFSSRTVKGLSSRQQELLYEHLEASGHFNTPPEDFVNTSSLAKKWGIAHNAVRRAIESLGEELGEIKSFRAGPMTTEHFSIEQQGVIREHLEERGLFQPPVPEGYLSISGIAKAMGIDHATTAMAIDDLKEILGDGQVYRFKTRVAVGYTPEQQTLIHDYLEAKGTLVKPATDGVLSVHEFARDLGIGGSKPIERAIETLGDELGMIGKYRFGSRKALGRGLTVEQQQMVKDQLAREGLLSFTPDGYVGITDIASQFNVGDAMVRKAIEVLGEEGRLGEIGHYRSPKKNGPAFPHFSPEQQTVIVEFLQSNGYIDNNPPEGFITATTLAKAFGVGQIAIYKATEEMKESFGEIRSFKFKSKVTAGYSPEQQEKLKAYVKSRQHITPRVT